MLPSSNVAYLKVVTPLQSNQYLQLLMPKLRKTTSLHKICSSISFCIYMAAQINYKTAENKTNLSAS